MPRAAPAARRSSPERRRSHRSPSFGRLRTAQGPGPALFFLHDAVAADERRPAVPLLLQVGRELIGGIEHGHQGLRLELLLRAGDFMALAISALILSTIGRGVPAGAT